jgi:alpha-L-rhamnosidase
MMEMATAIEGEPGRESVAKYTAMYAVVKAAWHKKWFDTKNQWYQDGGQTAQILGLALDRSLPHIMSPTEKTSVLTRLVMLIKSNANHSTSGIIGFKHAHEVLSENGYGDLAYSMMTQTSYPSLGYQILNKYEPATTVWELVSGIQVQ